MVTESDAMSWWRSLPKDLQRDAIRHRMVQSDFVPVGTLRGDEAAEDVLVALLQAPDCLPDTKAMIVDVIISSVAELVEMHRAGSPHGAIGARRVTRVAELTGNLRLKPAAVMVLHLAVLHVLPRALLSAAVRAMLRFPVESAESISWSTFCADPVIGRYALRLCARSGMSRKAVVNLVASVWHGAKQGSDDIGMAHTLSLIAKEQGGNELIREVLARLAGSPNYDRIYTSIRALQVTKNWPFPPTSPTTKLNVPRTLHNIPAISTPIPKMSNGEDLTTHLLRDIRRRTTAEPRRSPGAYGSFGLYTTRRAGSPSDSRTLAATDPWLDMAKRTEKQLYAGIRS